MKNLKVSSISSGSITFDNGMILYSEHEQSCCEWHYLSMEDLTIYDFEGLKFDLSNDNFFERIEEYGIALKPLNGFPVRIPGYGSNKGFYTSNLNLVITNTDGVSIYKEYVIDECQFWEAD